MKLKRISESAAGLVGLRHLSHGYHIHRNPLLNIEFQSCIVHAVTCIGLMQSARLIGNHIQHPFKA